MADRVYGDAADRCGDFGGTGPGSRSRCGRGYPTRSAGRPGPPERVIAGKRIRREPGIPVIAAGKNSHPEFLQTLGEWQPEIIVVVAYGRILPKSILELAPQGCLNVHYSLLPKYRGAAPAAWTIINGEAEGGVTTMRLVEKMDAGAIYLQESLPLAAR